MRRKNIWLLSTASVIFIVASLLAVRYVSMSTFNASGDGGGQSLVHPTFGIVDPNSKPVMGRTLTLDYMGNKVAFSCPPGWWYDRILLNLVDASGRQYMYLKPTYPDKLVFKGTVDTKITSSITKGVLAQDGVIVYGTRIEYSQPKYLFNGDSGRLEDAYAMVTNKTVNSRVRFLPKGTKTYDTREDKLYTLSSVLRGPGKYMGELSDLARPDENKTNIGLCANPSPKQND